MKRILSLLLTFALLLSCAPFACAETVVSLQTIETGSCGDGVTWEFDPDTGALSVTGSGAIRNYGNSYGGDGSEAPWSSYKSSIQSVVIGSGVTGVGNEAFAGCTALAHVTLPDGLTRIGYSAFAGCSALKEISLPDSLTSIGAYAFFYSGLGFASYENAKYLGNSVNPYLVLVEAESKSVASVRMHDGAKCIAENAFAKCAALKTVTLAGSVTHIGADAFSGCEKLTWTYFTGDLAAWCGIAFANAAANPLYAARAKNLNVGGNWIAGNLAIPDGVTRIGAYAFSGCDRLASVSFPVSVTQIGSGAFADCLNLTDVHYAGTQEQWESVDRGSDEENEALFFALLHENSTGPRTPIPGDVNRDNIVNAKDITLLRRHLAGGYGVELG